MSYEYRCGTCENFKDKDKTYLPFDIKWAEKEKGYCDWYRCFYWADDSCDKHYKKRSGSSSSSCYITTVVCDILGYADNCPVLNTMRDFRNNVLQQKDEYKDILYEYDTVGPTIAYNLYEDYQENYDIEFATALFNFYILPTVKHINDKEYKSAVERYQEMTNALKEIYCINSECVVDESYDASRGGHGTFYKKGSIE